VKIEYAPLRRHPGSIVAVAVSAKAKPMIMNNTNQAIASVRGSWVVCPVNRLAK